MALSEQHDLASEIPVDQLPLLFRSCYGKSLSELEFVPTYDEILEWVKIGCQLDCEFRLQAIGPDKIRLWGEIGEQGHCPANSRLTGIVVEQAQRTRQGIIDLHNHTNTSIIGGFVHHADIVGSAMDRSTPRLVSPFGLTFPRQVLFGYKDGLPVSGAPDLRVCQHTDNYIPANEVLLQIYRLSGEQIYEYDGPKENFGQPALDGIELAPFWFVFREKRQEYSGAPLTPCQDMHCDLVVPFVGGLPTLWELMGGFRGLWKSQDEILQLLQTC